MIEVENLSKRYGDKLAVDGLSFVVQPGMVTGFLGPNGAGKSTTMRMIAGLDEPTDGPGRRQRWRLPVRRRSDGRARRAARGQGGAHRPIGAQPPARAGADQRHQPPARGRGDRHRRPARGGRQAGRRLLARHGSAARRRLGAARQPADRRPRRAGQRPRPGGRALDAQPCSRTWPPTGTRCSCRRT